MFFNFIQKVPTTTVLRYVNLCTRTLCEHHPNSMLNRYLIHTKEQEDARVHYLKS